MLRFAEFESHGLTMAAITEARDGDFALRSLQDSSDPVPGLDPGMRSLHIVSQVHGNKVLTVESGTPGISIAGEADALATGVAGAALGIRIADCVPVFLFDPASKCIALAHAGREGTRAGISKAVASVLKQDFGADPATLRALIGPSAGPCCYEVDPDTAKSCLDSGLRVSGRMVDLWASNRDQLLEAGLRLAHVDVAGICTICSQAFHSHRRTGTRQRNLAVLML